MKQILLIFILATSISPLNAQKGKIVLGGTIGLGTSQQKQESNGNEVNVGKSTSWEIAPDVGLYVTDHLQLGLAATFGGQKEDNQSQSNNVYRASRYGGKLYGRYFFGTKDFKPFAGASFRLSPGNYKYGSAGTVTNKGQSTNLGANLSGGFSYVFSKRLMAITSLSVISYDYLSTKDDNSNVKNKFSSFGFNLNPIGGLFNLGFYFVI